MEGGDQAARRSTPSPSSSCPPVYLLGLFTHVRVVQSSIEDIFYGCAINRIRGVYRQLAGSEARYFLLGGHDDVYGVLANMGIGKPSRWQLYLTLGTMVAVVNSVVGGTTVALAVGVLGASMVVSVLTGGAALVASLAFHSLIQRRTLSRRARRRSQCSPRTALSRGSCDTLREDQRFGSLR
jgi:hypothetical protein